MVEPQRCTDKVSGKIFKCYWSYWSKEGGKGKKKNFIFLKSSLVFKKRHLLLYFYFFCAKNTSKLKYLIEQEIKLIL